MTKSSSRRVTFITNAPRKNNKKNLNGGMGEGVLMSCHVVTGRSRMTIETLASLQCQDGAHRGREERQDSKTVTRIEFVHAD